MEHRATVSKMEIVQQFVKKRAGKRFSYRENLGNCSIGQKEEALKVVVSIFAITTEAEL